MSSFLHLCRMHLEHIPKLPRKLLPAPRVLISAHELYRFAANLTFTLQLNHKDPQGGKGPAGQGGKGAIIILFSLELICVQRTSNKSCRQDAAVTYILRPSSPNLFQ